MEQLACRNGVADFKVKEPQAPIKEKKGEVVGGE
jgi:hypothetical protein